MHDDHPDLVELDRYIRTHLDRVLRAEQEAADLTRRRTATLRDRLIDLEERGESVIVRHRGGETAGLIESVGADHFDLLTVTGTLLLPLAAIVSVRSL